MRKKKRRLSQPAKGRCATKQKKNKITTARKARNQTGNEANRLASKTKNKRQMSDNERSIMNSRNSDKCVFVELWFYSLWEGPASRRHSEGKNQGWKRSERDDGLVSEKVGRD